MTQTLLNKIHHLKNISYELGQALYDGGGGRKNNYHDLDLIVENFIVASRFFREQGASLRPATENLEHALAELNHALLIAEAKLSLKHTKFEDADVKQGLAVPLKHVRVHLENEIQHTA